MTNESIQSSSVSEDFLWFTALLSLHHLVHRTLTIAAMNLGVLNSLVFDF